MKNFVIGTVVAFAFAATAAIAGEGPVKAQVPVVTKKAEAAASSTATVAVVRHAPLREYRKLRFVERVPAVVVGVVDVKKVVDCVCTTNVTTVRAPRFGRVLGTRSGVVVECANCANCK